MKTVNWESMHTYTEKALKKTWALLENSISLSADDVLKLSEVKREYEESVAKETKGKFRMKFVDVDDSKESKEEEIKTDKSLTDIFEELIDDAMKHPGLSKTFRSNEFFYETLNYQIKWENPLYTTISKLALRNIIELAYNEGQKDALVNAEEKVQKWAEDVINKKVK